MAAINLWESKDNNKNSANQPKAINKVSENNEEEMVLGLWSKPIRLNSAEKESLSNITYMQIN